MQKIECCFYTSACIMSAPSLKLDRFLDSSLIRLCLSMSGSSVVLADAAGMHKCYAVSNNNRGPGH